MTAVQIAKVEEGELIFCKDALFRILAEVPSDLPVTMISVVGAFRSGKSFLLNLLIRFFKDEKTEKIEHRFESRAGDKRCTTGLWVWSEHFILQDSEGEDIAVLLMDTQGFFDGETSEDLTAALFAISSLMSSRIIYNISHRLNDLELNHIAVFAQLEWIADKQNSNGEDNAFMPIQHFEFLFRNFQDLEILPEDIEQKLGLKLKAFLSLKERNDPQLRAPREYLKASCNKITCFGLPHPGIPVTKKNFSGEVSSVDTDFLECFRAYGSKLKRELSTKKIFGDKVTSHEFGNIFNEVCKLYINKKPDNMAFFTAIQESRSAKALELAKKKYMEVFDGSAVDYSREDVVLKAHDEASKAAIVVYEKGFIGITWKSDPARAQDRLDTFFASQKIYHHEQFNNAQATIVAISPEPDDILPPISKDISAVISHEPNDLLSLILKDISAAISQEPNVLLPRTLKDISDQSNFPKISRQSWTSWLKQKLFGFWEWFVGQIMKMLKKILLPILEKLKDHITRFLLMVIRDMLSDVLKAQ